ncbi:hypothetical protein TI39_contig406g00005 [Zymoseptoria brevis]|uniref:Uncharacterized protein n=1 Tax=Zymoseptoria brevis TaxID=1047168 RepID=A0A0F4GMA2_9PEZI|nr:hypothetical protein TI39_contig406g00005 [Zymoseptoria brevis]
MDHNYQPSYQSFNPYTTNYDAGRHTSNDDTNPSQYNHHASSSSRPPIDPAPSTPLTSPSFDILEWHPAYQSCQRYFLDHAQHDPGTQAVCALINIRLPFQWLGSPVTSSSQSSGAGTSAGGGGGPGQRSSSHTGVPSGSTNHAFTFSSGNGPSNMRMNPSPSRAAGPPIFVSPIPYIRRLVVTGFDKPPILHGFFGDDYIKGIMPHVECERRNYLFAAKSGGWRSCKRAYDVGSGGGVGGGAGGDETVPFMKALKDVPAEEQACAFEESRYPFNQPQAEYLHDHEEILKREVEAEKRLKREIPLGMKKMGVDAGEKFFLDYWAFEGMHEGDIQELGGNSSGIAELQQAVAMHKHARYSIDYIPSISKSFPNNDHDRSHADRTRHSLGVRLGLHHNSRLCDHRRHPPVLGLSRIVS